MILWLYSVYTLLFNLQRDLYNLRPHLWQTSIWESGTVYIFVGVGRLYRKDRRDGQQTEEPVSRELMTSTLK